ncbi:AAA family ATPase [Brevibacillus sp. SYSU BS000544]|uniref:AAA family ATPase n=1 Tax=Brevibacillus sp. SYSU BS000544 TaxID=3416443 RepID=UPI003CE44A57
MLLKTFLHTIFILVGPTECGKSTFVEKVLVPQLTLSDPKKNFKTNVQVISSDVIRRDILGQPYDKHDQIMMEASAQAFDLLEKKVEVVTSFPVNAEFVIVDTKGLSEEFRNQICMIAKRNNYNVEVILFDYKNTQDYYQDVTKSRAIISRDVRRLRTDVLANLKKGQYRHIHRVRGKDFLEGYQVEIANMDLYLKSLLPVENDYFIVGDVHEEVDSLKQLFRAQGFKVEGDKVTPDVPDKNRKAILVGDWIDKGNKTEETIHFIYKNRDHILLVKGNHENFVYKLLKGELQESDFDDELIQTHFTSIAELEGNEDLKQMFYELVEDSVEFYRYIGISKNSFYVTHAPCHNKYVGKLDSMSLKKQRNFRIERDKDYHEQLNFLLNEAVGNHPYHVFGHVASKSAIRLKNKLGIDTGAVYGNRLLSVSFGNQRVFFKSVEGSSAEKIELPNLFEQRTQGVLLDDLTEEDRKKLQYVLQNKINFISGTISPADKNVETGELESLEKGLRYFQSKGVKKVTLQPKYMGSRCTIYLHKTWDESFAVSRNGYKIKNVDLSNIYLELHQKFSPLMEERSWKTMILDGELLPWMALGKGLIEKEFRVIDSGISEEIEFLKQSGFEEKMGQLFDAYSNSEYSKDQHHLSKKELREKYGEALTGNYKHVHEIMNSFYSLALHEEAYQLYHQQVELHGADGDITFKPFSLLKSVHEDDREEFPTQVTSEVFQLISEDESIVVDFDDPDHYETANDFYLTLTTDRGMEGVVIKPEEEKVGVAPAMKVRNPEYLRLIYGYDYTFPHKFKSLFSQKNIGQKLATSINEHKLGKQMLSFPLHSISDNNREYQQVVANMLFETNKESGIDPRL